jgi:hypothetical protein
MSLQASVPDNAKFGDLAIIANVLLSNHEGACYEDFCARFYVLKPRR